MEEKQTVSDRVALLGRFVDAYNERTLHEDAETIFAPDLVVDNQATGVETTGIDAYLEHAVDDWLAVVPDARVELVDYELRKRGIEFTLLTTGTFTGELETPEGTVPGTGESFEMEFHIEAETEDGRIVRWVPSYDMANWQAQVGLTE